METEAMRDYDLNKDEELSDLEIEAYDKRSISADMRKASQLEVQKRQETEAKEDKLTERELRRKQIREEYKEKWQSQEDKVKWDEHERVQKVYTKHMQKYQKKLQKEE